MPVSYLIKFARSQQFLPLILKRKAAHSLLMTIVYRYTYYLFYKYQYPRLTFPVGHGVEEGPGGADRVPAADKGHVVTRLYGHHRHQLHVDSRTTGVNFKHRQCCGSGSGNWCLFDPWIRDPKPIFLRA
jgi:hypothetical protein